MAIQQTFPILQCGVTEERKCTANRAAASPHTEIVRGSSFSLVLKRLSEQACGRARFAGLAKSNHEIGTVPGKNPPALRDPLCERGLLGPLL